MTIPDSCCSAPAAEWTFLLYTGTKKNGSRFTRESLLRSVEGASLSSRLNFVYEISGMEATERGRLVLDPASSKIGVEVLSSAPPIATASPTNIAAFIDWATSTFPSRYTALVFKDHGGGNDPPGIRTWMVPTPPPPLVPLRILEDGTTGDYVSDPDLRRILERTRRGRVDVFGFDACGMGLAEIAYEVRAVSSYMVATQAVLGFDAWPYRHAVTAMSTHPHLGPRDLAAGMARANPGAKLFATDLAWMKDLGEQLDHLGARLATLMATKADAIRDVRASLTRYSGDVDVDLLELLTRLRERIDDEHLKERLQKVEDKLRAACFAGERPFPSASGLGIFFPEAGSEYMVSYGELRLAQRTRWPAFIARYCFPAASDKPRHSR
jgi:hypothetical protein